MHRFIVILIGLSALIVTAVVCSEEEAEDDGIAMIDQLIACDGPGVWDRNLLLLNLNRDKDNTIELLKRNLKNCGPDSADDDGGVRTEHSRLRGAPQPDTSSDDGVAMIDQLIACDPGVWDRDRLLLNLNLSRRDTIEWVKHNLELYCGVDILGKNAMPSPTPLLSSSSFSRESLELLSAYHELLKFKDEPWFHSFCYGQASPAHAWGEYVTKIGIQTLNETGITGGDLREMGWDYCQNQGRESDLTKQKRQEMESRWLNHQPVPTPRSELRVDPGRPFENVSRDVAECIWNNPATHGIFQESMDEATDVSELTEIVELTISSGKVTMDDAIATLTACEATHPQE